jgi:glycosyltransferase involved in cell wall biosynthesis
MKVDVVICTLDPKQVRPKLMNVLEHAEWVNSIILETSKPLGPARLIAINKCTTEFVAMFDDDVEIPESWFDKVYALFDDSVVAVSSPDLSDDPTHHAFQLISDRILKLSKRDTPYVDNTLFRKSAWEGYDPPLAFYCEDEILYEFIKTKGKWLHTPPIGVKHYSIEKDPIYHGASYRIYKFEPFLVMMRRELVRFALAVFIALFYTHTWKTVYLLWRANVRIMAGFIMGESLRPKIGISKYDDYRRKFEKATW